MTDSLISQPATDLDQAALTPGRQVGRYEIVSILGQGGFGITYRARDTELGRQVAIKEYLPTSLAVRQDGTTVLPRSTKMAEDFTWGRDRFVAEGRTLASLDHASAIVRVFDFLQANGTAYIVMELVSGETLEGRIKRAGPLDRNGVESILWPLLDGLEQVHAAGFLHRDIKPANILLREDGKPTLIDFGASRAAMAGRTTAMTAIFTPGYAAAEQMTSAKQGPWTDIYGLAATLYNAITGAPPPPAFDRMLDDGYEPLARISPAGFPPNLLIGIDAGLAVRSTERPQTIAGWRGLLSMTGAVSGDQTQLVTADPSATVLAPRAPAPQPPAATPAASVAPALSEAVPLLAVAPPPAPKAGSKTPLYAGVAAAVLLLAGAGGYLGTRPSAPSAPTATAATGTTPKLQDMKVEDLERALAERRAAEADAAEKRRAEEDAKLKADADSAAKIAADAEVAKAEAARQKAEAELAKLKVEMEARRLDQETQTRKAEAEAAQRKAEAEMAALKAAEDAARRKAAVEAEAKRLADEALGKAQAERLKADEDARQKAATEAKEKSEASAKQIAEAESKAKPDAEPAKAKADAEAERKSAEAAESALRLSVTDRQRTQVALTSLGFDTRGSDGAFGPRSREMIAAYQKARNQSATGFLTGAQNQALLRDAASALQKYDDEQKRKKEEDEKKKAEEAKRKADDDAKAKDALAASSSSASLAPSSPKTAPPPTTAPSAPAGGAFDGVYSGAITTSSRQLTIKITGTSGTGTFSHQSCGSTSFGFQVSPSGQFTSAMKAFDSACAQIPANLSGSVSGRQIEAHIGGPGFRINGTLTRQ